MSDEENSDKSTEMKGLIKRMVMHYVSQHNTEQCSSVESMEDIAIEAADNNLKLLLSHLQLATLNNNSFQ
jgi:hypothetical protein